MEKGYIEREVICENCNNKDICFPYPEMRAKCPVYKTPAADVEPVRHGEWTGIEGDICSECGASLAEIMDADSYFAIGFNPNDLVACPFCGAKMDGGKK